MRLKLDLAPDTAVALTRRAVRDLRPVTMEAEALLRQALGLPVPWPEDDPAPSAPASGAGDDSERRAPPRP